MLESQFRGASLDALGVGALTAGLQPPPGAALAYLRETQGESLAHLTRIQRLVTGEAMLLDPTAVATLELFETAQERTTRGSLFATLDATSTPMGARLLRQWMLRPLLDREAIVRRQEAVAPSVDAPAAQDGLRRRLGAWGTWSGSPAARPSAWPTPATSSPCGASWAACRGSRRRWEPSTAPFWGRSPKRSLRCLTFRSSLKRPSRTSRRSR